MNPMDAALHVEFIKVNAKGRSYDIFTRSCTRVHRTQTSARVPEGLCHFNSSISSSVSCQVFRHGYFSVHFLGVVASVYLQQQ